jgi:hypothetical protein
LSKEEQEIGKRTKIVLIKDYEKYEDKEFGIKFYPKIIVHEKLHESFVTRKEQKEIYYAWMDVSIEWNNLLREKNHLGKKNKVTNAQINKFVTNFNRVWKAVKEGKNA